MPVLRIVVLGTGTGVGKTFVASAVASHLSRSNRLLTTALKPVETGFPPDLPQQWLDAAERKDTDAALLGASTFHVKRTPRPRYTFAEPISPHLAARRTGERIELEAIRSWVEEHEEHAASSASGRTVLSIIETAGGAFSPLSDTATNADLAQILEPAYWVLVAPDALGVLHDLRATELALGLSARSPDEVVLSRSRAPDESTGSNEAELRRLGTCTEVTTVSDVASARPLAARLEARAWNS